MFSNIKFGNIDLTADNGYYVTALKGLGYATKYPVAKVAQFHGAKIGNAFYDNRVLEIDIKIVGTSVNDYIAKRKALFAELTINEFSDDLNTIEITLNNGIVLTAEGVAQSLGDDIDTTSIVAGDVAFTFEMQEPFFKSKQQYQQDIPITQGGGCAIPMAIPLDMTEGSTGYTQLSQAGNIFCFPELYFYGELTNPVLTNITLNKTLSLTATIAALANYRYIDTYNRIVTDETGANKRDEVSGDFLVLASGTNEFSLSTDNAGESGYVRVIYKDFYISL